MSLHDSYDDNNLFARILRGEIPCAKVFEDEACLAFMDVFPQSEGHVLVTPKTIRARTLFDMPDQELCQLYLRVKWVAKAVRKALQPDGVTITQFNGAAAGQTVFHLHVHIIPRREGQQLARHGQKSVPMRELHTLAQKIANAAPENINGFLTTN